MYDLVLGRGGGLSSKTSWMEVCRAFQGSARAVRRRILLEVPYLTGYSMGTSMSLSIRSFLQVLFGIAPS